RNSRSRFRAVLMLSPMARAGSRSPAGVFALWLSASLFVVTCAGCAATASARRGHTAEQQQDYDRALVEYTKAVRLHPDDTNARAGLERAKLRSSEDHFQRGRRLAAVGKYDQALVEYELAAEMNPTNGDIDQELRSTRNRLRAKVTVAHEGKTELQTLIE